MSRNTAAVSAFAIAVAFLAFMYYGQVYKMPAHAQPGGPSIPAPVCNQIDKCPLFVGLQKQVGDLEKEFEAKLAALEKKFDEKLAKVVGVPAKFKIQFAVPGYENQCLAWIGDKAATTTADCNAWSNKWKLVPTQ